MDNTHVIQGDLGESVVDDLPPQYSTVAVNQSIPPPVYEPQATFVVAKNKNCVRECFSLIGSILVLCSGEIARFNVKVLVFLIPLAPICVYSIVQLAYGIINKGATDCEAFMDPAVWLIVSGATQIGVSLLEALLKLCDINLNCSRGFYGTFLIVWAIIGTVILWQHCSDMTPYSVRVLLWVHSICFYLLVLFICVCCGASNSN